MKKTVDPEWICGFQRNLAFIHKLEEALSPGSFKRVCEFMNEYRMKKRCYGYRIQDRAEIEKQMTPLLVACDQNLLCEFREILATDVAEKSMPSMSNDTNAMHDPDVEFDPRKSGHPSTKPSTFNPIQLETTVEVAHHHTRKHKGSITFGKSVGFEDVPELNLDDSSHPKRRRLQRPMVEPINSNGTHHNDVVDDVSSKPKKRKDCDKHMHKEKQDEHIVHGDHVRQPSKKYLGDAATKGQLVFEDTNRTRIRSSVVNGNNSRILKSEDAHQLHKHHDDKRMYMLPGVLELSSDEVQKAPAAAFLVNLSKLGDRSLQECIKNILQLFRDKKLPSYYANKCICMLLEAHKKLLTEFCELIGFQWLIEVNLRSYNGGHVGLRDRAYNQYTYIEEAAKNNKLCSLEKDIPVFEVDNMGRNICKATISLETQLHKDMLEEKQFSDNLKAKLKGSRNYRWWPGCTLEHLTPNIGSKFQVSPEYISKNIPKNRNGDIVTPNVSFEFQVAAMKFLADPRISNDNVVAPNVSFKVQALATKFLVDPLISNDQTTTIDSQKNELISQGTSPMRRLELDLSSFWLEKVVALDDILSNVKRMLCGLQEHPPK